jgi:hypothetical protein
MASPARFLIPGAALAIALLLSESVIEAIRSIPTERPVIIKSNREAMRWFDDRLGRTTLRAIFAGSEDAQCLHFVGLLEIGDGRVELLYPRPLPPDVDFSGTIDNGILTLQSKDCRVRIHVSKEVLAHGAWFASPSQGERQ